MQAHAAARRLQGAASIISSAARCSVRSRPPRSSPRRRPKPVVIDDGIIECDFGSLEGRSVRDTMDERGLRTAEDLVSILPADGDAGPRSPRARWRASPHGSTAIRTPGSCSSAMTP